jgi:catechol 2,3-dioxygenase-like lactoylglutathione lyase family enzyme
MSNLPTLEVLSIKIPVSDLAASRHWYADVFGLVEVMEWPDEDGVVRGVAFSGLGSVLLALRQDEQRAAATKDFGFLNIKIPTEEHLAGCAEHLDRLGIPHTPVINGANGRLIGFWDPDGHELSFYAEDTNLAVHPGVVRTIPPQP